MRPRVIGIDIGGVIIKRIDANADTSFLKDFLQTPAVDDAIEVIREFVDTHIVDEVYLVSKCGPEVEALTRQWLAAHFFPRSNVSPHNVRFCREREQKAGICKVLGVTHFVDDRLEVLGYLESVDNLYLFQPRQEEVIRFTQYFDRVHLIHSWREIRENLLSTM